MKNIKKITTLLLALVMMLMMSQAVFAQDKTADGGAFRFDGNDLSWDESSGSIVEAIDDDFQPGDTVKIRIYYYNDSSEETRWYLRNDVVYSLEDLSELGANGGGYSYKLSNDGATVDLDIFDSDAVGGDDTYEPGGIAKGLHGATDATNMEDYFYIDTVPAYGYGHTDLIVGLDGESQANDYFDSIGELQIEYAVEVAETEDVYRYIRRKVDTGDRTNLWLPVVAFITALILLILAVFSYKKDRKDGEA